MRRGVLVVLSGPSGSGKTEIIKRLSNVYPRAITATTREPRSGERDGVDYFFLTRDAFECGIERGDFLEWASYNGNLYGTPKEVVKSRLDKGEVVPIILDVQGAATVRRMNELASLSVFIAPPSLEVLRERLQGQERDDLENRMAIAEKEMERAYEFDYVVVNDTIEEAVSDIQRFVEAKVQIGNGMGEMVFCGLCSSTDVHTEKDVGYDVDESGEERQHLDVCHTCKAWRLHTERFVNFRDYKEHFGEWSEQDEMPPWIN